MARLQILELPEGSGDDRPPFVLVVDQADDAFRHELGDPSAPMRDAQADLAKTLGARAVLVFRQPVDIPGNEVPLDPDGYPVKMRIEPDFETFREQVQDEIRKTQRELTQAVNRDPASERTEITRETYLLIKKKGDLLDALGMDRNRDWDDIRNAAAALRKERETQAETLERVRNLPEQPQVTDAQHPDPSSYLHGYGVAIREAKRATWGQPASVEE